MDRDDAEKRIAELEQLAVQRGHTELPPASRNHAGPARRFWASPPIWGSKWTFKRAKIVGYGLPVLFVGLFVVPMLATQLAPKNRVNLEMFSSAAGMVFVALVVVG